MGSTPGPGELETSNGWLTTVEKLKKILRSIKCERSKFLRLINSSFETEVVDVADANDVVGELGFAGIVAFATIAKFGYAVDMVDVVDDIDVVGVAYVIIGVSVVVVDVVTASKKNLKILK